MDKPWSLLTLAVLLSALCARAADEESSREGAFLIVSRELREVAVTPAPSPGYGTPLYPGVVQNRNFTVHYELVNVGGAPATDVTIIEGGFSERAFKLRDGFFTARVGEISVGETKTSAIILAVKYSGMYDMKPAKITYRDGATQTLRTTTSTTDTYLLSESEKSFQERTDVHLADWAMVLGASALLTLGPYALYSSTWSSLQKAQAKKRQ